jgi:thiamine pyrophosphate-dependent acetolactate synthase large subunit-like protein
MTGTPIYEALAQAFVAEGVDTFFALMGDGNMHWCTALKNIDGVEMFHSRHEHAAVCMAMAYWSATGKVGVASTTCGPGFTQIMTALATAVRARVPLVVFAGEAPIGAKWYHQFIDQSPFAMATGAHYIAAHAPVRMHIHVREAFHIARHERRPVVIGVPYDVQKQPMPDIGSYAPSSTVVPQIDRLPPNPEKVDTLVAKLVAAKCPVILAGKGVIASGARREVEELAERTGAILANTLLARGLYDHNPFSINVAGGFARSVARDVGAKADLVLAIGASMTYWTVDGGGMFPKAEIAQIDIEPAGLRHGAKVADVYLRADAKLSVQAMLDRLGARPKTAAAIRTPELARRIKDEPADSTNYNIEPNVLDPRDVVRELDIVLAKDYDTICGSGHQSFFHTTMRGWDPEKYHIMRDFGAIGSGLSYTVGVAAARRNGKVLLIEGDGSLLMHIQEFETLKRHGLKCLICVMNDGAYGSEIHKLRQEGIDDSGAIFGRPDFAAIAQGFGLRGTKVTDVGQFRDLFEDYQAHDEAEIWDIPISDKVQTPRMRKTLKAGHGVM